MILSTPPSSRAAARSIGAVALSLLSAVAQSVLPIVAPLHAQADVVARSALSEPSISPDGDEIAFVSGGDIWTVPGAGGIARLLITHPATESRPLWSPDGKQLAFVSTRTGGGDVYVFDLASGRLTRRTFSDGREQLDAWSRDGAWLYFSSSSADISGMNDVWRVSTKGGQPAPVAADRYASEFWGAPSPDGKTLYQGRINDLYLGPTKRQREVKTHDLRDALTAIREGKPVANPRTEAMGCGIVIVP